MAGDKEQGDRTGFDRVRNKAEQERKNEGIVGEWQWQDGMTEANYRREREGDRIK